MKITQGHGADVVYDPVGMIVPSLKCIAWNGRLIIVGFAAGSIEKVSFPALRSGGAKRERSSLPTARSPLTKLLHRYRFRRTCSCSRTWLRWVCTGA